MGSLVEGKEKRGEIQTDGGDVEGEVVCVIFVEELAAALLLDGGVVGKHDHGGVRRYDFRRKDHRGSSVLSKVRGKR